MRTLLLLELNHRVMSSTIQKVDSMLHEEFCEQCHCLSKCSGLQCQTTLHSCYQVLHDSPYRSQHYPKYRLYCAQADPCSDNVSTTHQPTQTHNHQGCSPVCLCRR